MMTSEQAARLQEFFADYTTAIESGRDFHVEWASGVSPGAWHIRGGEGLFSCTSQYRIVYKPEEVWKNVNPHSHSYHGSKDDADLMASAARIRCVHMREVVE